MRPLLTRLLLGAAMVSAAASAQAQDWGDLAVVSSTLGVSTNRLCLGAPATSRTSDLGCPTYSPYVSATSGFLGIGTTSPQYALDVSAGTVNGLRYRVNARAYAYWNTTAPLIPPIATGTGLLELGFAGNVSASNAFATRLNANLTSYLQAFDNGGVPYFAFVSGTVGIGTTAPSTTLTVSGSQINTSWTAVNLPRLAVTPLEVSGTVSATNFIGNGSGLTNITAASSDRITSGTTSMVAISNTGYISLTQAGTNTGWFNPQTGFVTIGVSSTGPISGTTGYFGGLIQANGSDSITSSPPSVGTNVGWKLGLYSSSYAIGVAGSTVALRTGNFVSFYNSTPLSDAVANVSQDTRAFASFHPQFNVLSGTLAVGRSSSGTATLQVSGTFTVSNSAQTTTPRLFVDSSGKIGIGTAAPVVALEVSSAAALTARFGSGSNGRYIDINPGSASIDFYGNSGTSSSQVWHIGRANYAQHLVLNPQVGGAFKCLSSPYMTEIVGRVAEGLINSRLDEDREKSRMLRDKYLEMLQSNLEVDRWVARTQLILRSLDRASAPRSARNWVR